MHCRIGDIHTFIQIEDMNAISLHSTIRFRSLKIHLKKKKRSSIPVPRVFPTEPVWKWFGSVPYLFFGNTLKNAALNHGATFGGYSEEEDEPNTLVSLNWREIERPTTSLKWMTRRLRECETRQTLFLHHDWDSRDVYEQKSLVIPISFQY